MVNRIALLRAIEQDWKKLMTGEPLPVRSHLPGRILMPLGMMIAFVNLIEGLKEYHVVCGVIGVICLFIGLLLFVRASMPPESWEKKIDSKLRNYQPRDIEAWKTLRVSVLKEGKLKQEAIRLWLDAEFRANADLLGSPASALDYGFVHRDV